MKDPTLIWVLWAGLVALAGVVGIVIRAVLTGKLVPAPTLERAYAESDKWEKAWHVAQQTIQEGIHTPLSEFGGRLDANTEGLRLVERIVDALVSKGPAR